MTNRYQAMKKKAWMQGSMNVMGKLKSRKESLLSVDTDLCTPRLRLTCLLDAVRVHSLMQLLPSSKGQCTHALLSLADEDKELQEAAQDVRGCRTRRR